MRSTIVVLLLSSCLAAQQQPDIWSRVDPNYNGTRLKYVTPSNAKLLSIAKLLHNSVESGRDMWMCEGADLDVMIKGLIFEEIPLAPGKDVLLAEAGRGCARGGQGANGAMWIISFDGDTPHLLASPLNDFNGWLFSIQPSTSFGFRDIVLGWHAGAGNDGLTYFRFDGKTYNAIGRASDFQDENGLVKIAPE